MATTRSARLAIVAVSAVLALAMSGCSATASVPRGVTIVEQNRQFVPSSVTVQVGDVVTFDNRDGIAHRVLINETDLGEQQPGVSVTWTAPAVGTFGFKCIGPHCDRRGHRGGRWGRIGNTHGARGQRLLIDAARRCA